MELYKKLIEKYNIEKLDTRCVEFLEMLNKLEFYEKRTSLHLKIIYKILCLLIEFLIKQEQQKHKNKTLRG